MSAFQQAKDNDKLQNYTNGTHDQNRQHCQPLTVTLRTTESAEEYEGKSSQCIRKG